MIRSALQHVHYVAHRVRTRFRSWTRPQSIGLLRDAFRSKRTLIIENALLRRQLIVARRQFKRPKLKKRDRLSLVFWSRLSQGWKEALLLVQPETVLRWHRHGFKLLWCAKSKPMTGPRIDQTTIALIRRLACENVLWGAERIRGELLKLGIDHAKETIQRYLPRDRPGRASGQRWATFIKNHAHEIWACDFLQLYDARFRAIFAFFIIEHASRKVVYFGVTRNPTDAWVAQQLREATPFGDGPRFLIRDRDQKYGKSFANVAKGTGIKVLKTPRKAPRANAICERFLGSARRECLDHVLIFSQGHLHRTLQFYVNYFNTGRPHQGIDQLIPTAPKLSKDLEAPIVVTPILGGLHHDYRRAA